MSPEPTPPTAPALPSPRATRSTDRDTAERFLVAIGVGTGGIDALSQLLKALPADTGLTLLIAQQPPAPEDDPALAILQRAAPFPVQWAASGATLARGAAYLLPAGCRISLSPDAPLIRSLEMSPPGGLDDFLAAFARDVRHRAVCVLLSGSSPDGVVGAAAVKTSGGFAFVQDPTTALATALPRAAIDRSVVDRVLPPAAIAQELVLLSETTPDLWHRLGAAHDDLAAGPEADQLAQILRIVAAQSGVDFSHYRKSAIKRRLVRRMLLAKAPDLDAYIRLLETNPDEVEELHDHLLINVTAFFRDPECFDYLAQHILPALVERHTDGSPVRVWVPGCATGEEAYSLAILLTELFEARRQVAPVQIFATDVSEHVIATARAGIYSAADLAPLSEERVRRFFYRTERGFVVHKQLRDMCIFAMQDVTRDPPFSRVDLISCRNLLIYLSTTLQHKIVSVFHYALAPAGMLLLGTSETVAGQADLFRLREHRFRIYERKPARRGESPDFTGSPPRAATPPPAPAAPAIVQPPDAIREADRLLLDRLALTGVVVNDALDVIQFRGDVSLFLSPPPGRPSLNVVKMARDGLAGELGSALDEARDSDLRVHRADITFLHGGVNHTVELEVTPFYTVHPRDRFFLVLFRSPPAGAPAAPIVIDEPKKPAHIARLEQLRQELHTTRNHLQAIIERHQGTNEELRAANEEIQSSNEELQSTNEELETAKEELQANNEELSTLNEELHLRQVELMQLNNDLTNLIDCVHLPIVILGPDLRIRRFTPLPENLFSLLPTDIGRPIGDVSLNLRVTGLTELLHEVFNSLATRELDVQDRRGHWYSLRLRPYRAADHRIEGVVLTLIDIDDLQRARADDELGRTLAQGVLDATPDAVAALDANGQVRLANPAFRQLFPDTTLPVDLRAALTPLLANATGGKAQTLRYTLSTRPLPRGLLLTVQPRAPSST